MRFLLFVTSIAAFGGFLFGYDTAVISGAIGFLTLDFGLGEVGQGWAGAGAILGCIPGAMFAGALSDRLGRRKILILSAVLYAVSGVVSALPRDFLWFIAGRLLGGLAIGASSMICPVYISEIAPEKHRGRLGALFQLGIVSGILLVFFVNLLIQRLGDESWNTRVGWRWMIGSESIPAAVFLGLLALVPESPRWLALHGRIEDARQILAKVSGAEHAEIEVARIVEGGAVGGEATLAEVFSGAYRRPLVIAVGLAIFSQFSGINAVMYYAPEIFKVAGVGTDGAFAATVWVGVVNFVFTLVAIAFVDRVGRRPLLLVGSALQTVALGVSGYLLAVGDRGPNLLVALLVFVAAFAIAMGPIPWIVISEIFPTRIRGLAASVGVFSIWAACFVVAQTFPILRRGLGESTTFALYAACSLAGLAFVAARVPETKGRTLEEIEASWRVLETASDLGGKDR